MTYRDKRLGFEITFPHGWRVPGMLHRLFWLPLRLMFASPALAGGPEFYGPANDSLKFAVGPISPEPSVVEHQRNVAAMASRHGHSVVEVSTIDVGGKTHATMVVDVPSPFGRMRLKNYFLIFRGTEYVVTASLEQSEQEYDEIVRTFRPIYSQAIAMDAEGERQRRFTVRYLRSCGWFIALMGTTCLVMYYFDIARTREHPLIVLLGTAFCIYGSWKMFQLAKRAQDTTE